jgi:hypothetical protein
MHSTSRVTHGLLRYVSVFVLRRASLKKALDLNGEQLLSRQVRIEVAERRENDRDRGFGGGGYNRGPPPEQQGPSDWLAARAAVQQTSRCVLGAPDPVT